jgi:hypothetical protein
VACWWRAAALQALSAYVMGVMGKGLAEDATQQVRRGGEGGQEERHGPCWVWVGLVVERCQ